MTWEFHPAKAIFTKYAEDWDRLNVELNDGHPYFDSRFIGPLLNYFATGKELLCLYRSNDFIEGALILQPNGAGHWSSFHPSQAQITPVLTRNVCLLETLLNSLPGFAWRIEFFAIDPRYAPDFQSLALPLIFDPYLQTIGIQLENDFPDYWRERPKKLISNIDRYFRRSEKEFGTPLLSKIENAADMHAGVSRFGMLESQGWKGKAGTAVSIENEQGAFYSETLRRFALTGQATIYELHAGERFAASRLVIACKHMVVFLKTTYEESLANIAPGRLMLNRVIQDQFAHNSGKTIEFYTNATRDQVEWATFACPVQNIRIFRSDFFATAFPLLKVAQRILRNADSRKITSDEVTTIPLVKACTSIEGFPLEQYDLRDFTAKDNIEVSIEWFDLLQKQVYPDHSSIRYYFFAENNHPTTILPLRLTTKGRVKTVESLSNYYTSLYSPLLTKDSDPLTLRRMLASATREHGGAHVMRFAPMDPESVAFKGLLNELRSIGWLPFRFFSFGNWYLKVEGDWAWYLKNRSGNLRSTIKRMNKKFIAEGGTLEIVSSLDGVEQAIVAFHEVYSASWKIPEPYPDFVPSLIRLLASNGMLRLGLARLQGRPIAAQLWIVGQDKASIYKVGYHEAFSSYSPGTVLTSHLLQHVIEQDQVKEVDFLIGDDKYKQIWMSDRRERWGIVAYNPRTFIGISLFLREISGRYGKLCWRKINTFFNKFKQRSNMSKNQSSAFSK